MLDRDEDGAGEEAWPLLEAQSKKRRVDSSSDDPSYLVLKLQNCQRCAILDSVINTYPEILDSDTLVMMPRVKPQPLLQNTTLVDFKTMVSVVLDGLKSLGRGQHMILLDFVLLTRVQVGFLFILTNLFEEVGFIRPQKSFHGIFLSEFKGEDNLGTLEKLQTLLEKDATKSETSNVLLSFLPMGCMTQEPLYSLLVAHNINLMRECSFSIMH